jgi:predicted PurR-regulated permease PerM
MPDIIRPAEDRKVTGKGTMAGNEGASSARRPDLLRVTLTILIAAGILSLVFLLWLVREALILTFAAVVVAVLLLATADPIKRHTRLSHVWAVTLVGAALLGLFALFGWSIGSQAAMQISELINRVPEAAHSLAQAFEQRFGIPLFGVVTRPDSAGPADGSAIQGLISQFVTLGTAVASVLSNLLLVIIGGFFFAADPGVYRTGIVKLFPKSQHALIDDTLLTCGRALRLWLIGKLADMAIVGILVWLGTWMIGLPEPLALALFAALTEFIPIIGPIIGAIPALLVSLGQGGNALLWTGLLYLAVQQVESNIIEPVIERRMVGIPPALLLFAVLMAGILFGAPGVVIAAPLTVVVYVAVKKLYVRHVLGEETPVPGDKRD